MTIPLTTSPGGIFRRLGRIGKVAQDMRIYQGTTLPADVLSLMGQYQATRLADVDGVPTQQAANQVAIESIMALLQQTATTTLQGMVNDDRPGAGASVESSLKELIRQLNITSDTVKACTVTAAATAFSTPVANNGNGVMVVTTKRGDGRVQENMYSQTEYVYCTSDSQSAGATLNQEGFTYTPAPNVGDVWSQLYPGGAGGSTPITAVDASVYQTALGNILYNGDFETFTTNTPNQWAALAGTPGTDFGQSTGQHFDGTSSLEFIGGTGTNGSLAQSFNSAAGSSVILQPDTVYVVSFWSKVDVVPAAGVLTVDLVDGTNATISDDQAAANSQAFTLSGFTSSFVNKTAVFRTPRTLPSTIKLRVRISTGLSGGSNLFIDRLAMTPATQLYPGGPAGAIFSGSIPFVSAASSLNGVADGFTLTTTNDYGGASNLSTFQQLFERLFGMRSLGLLLPSSGSPTIADSLIST